jgi:hypothetical protein
MYHPSSIPSPFVPPGRAVAPRSRPIAIPRSADDGQQGDSDIEDINEQSEDVLILDDSDVDPVVADAIRLGVRVALPQETSSSTRSIPSRLLRAPYLGAIRPTFDELDSINLNTNDSRIMLPPPAASTDNSEQAHVEAIAYGSLRDSHNRGRFLDGPCTYRDPITGDIRRLAHRAGYRDQSSKRDSNSDPVPSSLPNYALSIADRIQLSRRLQQQSHLEQLDSAMAISGESNSRETSDAAASTSNQPTPTTSSLSLILQQSTPTMNNTSHPPYQPPAVMEPLDLPSSRWSTMKESQNNLGRTPTFYDHELRQSSHSEVLSTSLTGLEILQHQRQERLSFQQQMLSEPREMPGSGLASSDSAVTRTPTSLYLGGRSPPSTTSAFQPLARTLSEPGQSGIGTTLVDGRPLVRPVPGRPSAALTPSDLPPLQNLVIAPNDDEQSRQRTSSLENPDTVGAFDMDLE